MGLQHYLGTKLFPLCITIVKSSFVQYLLVFVLHSTRFGLSMAFSSKFAMLIGFIGLLFAR